jgi:hypothetical protein
LEDNKQKPFTTNRYKPSLLNALHIYYSLLLHVYGAETWTMTKKEEQALLIFEKENV